VIGRSGALVDLAGLLIEVTGALDPEEIQTTDRLRTTRNGTVAFRLEVERCAPMASGPPAAIVEADALSARRIVIRHREFRAELDPFDGTGTLARSDGSGAALDVTLQVAAKALLPTRNALPLHGAGISLYGRGVVFFGVSGAGKSTISALSPHPVVSDELVAVAASAGGWRLRSTGFSEGLQTSPRPPARPYVDLPLAALVELGKGPTFRLEQAAPARAFRRLLDVAMVPPAAPLWAAGLSVLRQLAETVPVFRLEWTPKEAPWVELERALGRTD